MKEDRAIHRRISEYACAEPQTLRRDFQITSEGYDPWQVEDSRRRWGANVVAGRRADTVLYRLRRAFVTPFSMILLVLAAISFVTDVLLASNFSRNLTTVFIVLGMLLISGAVRFVQELRAKRVADHLTGMIATRVRVLRAGRWTELCSTELVVGDRVRLAAGDRVPADIRLTEAKDLFVSQSVITGESGVLEKRAVTLRPGTAKTAADYENIAFLGSTVMGGFGEGIVLAVGADTVYGGFSAAGAERKNGFDRGANSIAWVLIRFMAVLVPVVFAACGLTKGNWLSAFLFALSVAVGLTPELLPMVVNACLAKGCAAMGKKQTVVKTINAMQGFGSMDLLCVDKTGTLTGDVVALEYYMDVLGNESGRVLELAYLNSLYHTGVQNHLDDAILRCRDMPGQQERFESLARRCPKLDELPFDYERRLAGVLVGGKENLLIVKGSLDEVCRLCSHVEYKGQRLPMGPDAAASVHAVADEMLEDGMKVLAVACKPMEGRTARPEDVQELTLLGYLAFFDAPKKTAAAAVARLRELHVGVRVLTGDQKSVAVSICRRLGIDAEQVLTGPELESLNENDATMRIERTAVFAELSPKQKARVVAVLRANGHTVGFLGDGMNDLPAILESDVGISVDTAAQAVKEGADVILLKKDLNVLGEGILEGRRAFCNLSKYIRITASSNFGNIVSIVIASVLLPFFPMTAVQLLLLNLLYDLLCLALPWDQVDPEACARPLEWSGRTLGRFMRFFGPLSSIFDLLTFAWLFFVLCPAVCGGGFFQLAQEAQRLRFIALFQTGWFLESMWTQVLILHLLRTAKAPFLQSRPSRPVMLVTGLGIVLFTGLTFTPLGRLIGLTALPPVYFAFLAVMVALYLLLVSLAKGLYRKKYRELI
ncbi:magnesium-translocating P-type ATPase [Fournierella massiliensis]|uniref:Magnesium-transporting ATPase, P-type 1 n=1 Tax=Allofournierella massiliensis TaxID=1650663 RepID=A0ABT7ULY8_9FIRM|nr:magnesium-translocating P-type ATPase [Fournierella massiliensis]MDM8199916.1 magnesium-translocating P-type ATPase [Fournierella massiliensis]